MNEKELLLSLMRQTGFATSVLAGVLCMAERLVPGSVLPYLNIYWVVVLALLFAMIAPPRTSDRSILTAVGLIPAALLLVSFLFLLTSDLGRWGFILTGTALLTVVAVIVSFSYPPSHEYD